ncbi:MAG: fatty acid desaturase, partial [bacterium]|nr:fatty acid desaturase [bacterium]
TVEEYKDKGKWGRFVYRAYRNPFVMCSIGPIYYFFIKIRFPFIMKKKQKTEKRSIFYTNFAIAGLMGLLWLIELKLIVLYIVLCGLAFSIGIAVFYIQHNFEEAYWSRTGKWTFKDAALKGSSHFQLPRILDWLSGYISHHHVHHLDSKIPFYRLKACMAKKEHLQNPVIIKLRDVRKAFSFKLFDEQHNRMITFKGFRELVKTGAI